MFLIIIVISYDWEEQYFKTFPFLAHLLLFICISSSMKGTNYIKEIDK